MCKVFNSIGTHTSQPLALALHGAPKVTSDANNYFIVEGRNAKLEVEFCGSPLPKQTWLIESVEQKLVLTAGTDHDKKYRVDKEKKSEMNNCFTSVLHIMDTDRLDTKDYTLTLENIHGVEQHHAQVTIGEELSREALIGSVVGAAITVLLVVVVLICWCRRCCAQDQKMKQDTERSV